jgi:hypothetical protein
VVPAGSLQMENGFLETGSQGQSVLDGAESLVRFGVAKRTELRFTVPDYFQDLSAGGSGFGDFAFGVKEQLGPTPVSLGFVSAEYTTEICGALANIKLSVSRLFMFSSEVASGESRNEKASRIVWPEYGRANFQV